MKRSFALLAFILAFGDPLGKAEDKVHVVLDEEDRDVARQAGDDLEQFGAFSARDTGGRLVGKQDAWVRRERQGDLHQALFAVRQRMRGRQRVGTELQAA